MGEEQRNHPSAGTWPHAPASPQKQAALPRVLLPHGAVPGLHVQPQHGHSGPGEDRAEGLTAMFTILSCEGTACLNFCSAQRCGHFSRGGTNLLLSSAQAGCRQPSPPFWGFPLLRSLYLSHPPRPVTLVSVPSDCLSTQPVVIITTSAPCQPYVC